MTITVLPAKLKGAVTPPPSKSVSHRLILCAALADGESRLTHVAFSEDIKATLRCVEALGASYVREGENTIIIQGRGGTTAAEKDKLPVFDCGESGSTLRFMIPLALAITGGGVFTGKGRLMERPQKPYFDIFDELGISYERTGGELTVSGSLTAGEYRLPGNVSSQFFTGFLYALPLLEGESRIIPTTELESRDYIAMTVDAMAKAGVVMDEPTRNTPFFRVQGRATYSPVNSAVEADWSQAAFWYAAANLGSDLKIDGMNYSSLQGDRAAKEYFALLAEPGDVTIDVSGCPDLVPPLAAAAAVRGGKTVLANAARLRLKESDRLTSVRTALSALGAEIEEGADSLSIKGADSLKGGEVDCCNDHRIAMMAAVAATACTGPVRLFGAECVSKSYPDFWDVYSGLGGIIE